MNGTGGLDQLATFLRDRGLRTCQVAEGLTVANPVASGLSEVVRCDAGRYLTGWGYELGQDGDEQSSARRLAYLLGVPSESA